MNSRLASVAHRAGVIATRWRMLLVLLPLVGGPVAADLLPPQAARLSERFQRNPGSVDRTDELCDGRGIGDVCVIAGTPFEGGGPGRCERSINRNEYRFIDFRCTLQNPLQIDRQLPEGPFQADDDMCTDLSHEPDGEQTLARLGLVCHRPAPISDRFCQGRAIGDSCVAEVRVADEIYPSKGICKSEIQTATPYYRGRRVTSRPVVLCGPAVSPSSPPLKPVSAWRKLFQ